jgi:MGT family glycosyltransferase
MGISRGPRRVSGAKRFLLVAPSLEGHVNPIAAVAAELAARGHDVAWAGHREKLCPMLGPGAHVFPTGSASFATAAGLGQFRALWEGFVLPSGHTMRPGIDAACAAFAPDVLISDALAIAGGLVARQRGIVWASSALPAEFAPEPWVPEATAWVRRRMDEFQAAYGVTEPVDLRFSPDLVLAFTTAEFMGAGFPPPLALVGPALRQDRPDPTFPWEWLDPARRHVLVSMGTLNAGAWKQLWPAVLDATEELADELHLICVARPEMLADPPAHILVRRRVPQVDLLRHVDAVVSHGGYNTVCETLAHGVPLVVVPLRHDQPFNARRVVDAGAGIQVRFSRLGAQDLHAAVRAVLDDPSYREAARRLQASFTAAGGAASAADRLEQLAASSRRQPARDA